MYDIICFGDQFVIEKKSWHLTFWYFSQKLVYWSNCKWLASLTNCMREFFSLTTVTWHPIGNWRPHKITCICGSNTCEPMVLKTLTGQSNCSQQWQILWLQIRLPSHYGPQVNLSKLWQCQPMFGWLHLARSIDKGSLNPVCTCLFYQMCKVHDIVCFGD